MSNEYTDLITSEHSDKSNYMSVVAVITQAISDGTDSTAGMVNDYDLDTAVGAQLDAIGLWTRASRYLSVPLTNVYFSLDVAGLGFDQGTWFGPYDPPSGLVALPDDSYRTLIRATIAANMWDGTVPQAYAIWDALFGAQGYRILIQDNQDMSMVIGIVGPVPDAVTLALLTGGYLSLRPSGVNISFYVVGPSPGVPLFGFDSFNANISGFDYGYFASILLPT